jgi:spore germination protein GerM
VSLLFVAASRWWGRTSAPTAQAGSATPGAAPQRKITTTLYYVSDDGMSLVPTQREVPFGEPVVEQARHIIEAQLTKVDEPLASAIPAGTKLRALFLSERGDMFVDLSEEATRNHTGGALDELFTVYTIVNALTTNLPAIQRVQILINGREADTLAGHVDLRNPLSRNMSWVKTDNPS